LLGELALVGEDADGVVVDACVGADDGGAVVGFVLVEVGGEGFVFGVGAGG
jgi:hypothetical protein